MRNQVKKILVAEDDLYTREGLGEILREEGYEVEMAEDGKVALHMLGADADVDVLLADLKMPGLIGTDLAKEALRRNPNIVTIIMTAYGSSDYFEYGKEIGIYAWLKKPLNIERLLVLLKQVPVSTSSYAEHSSVC